MLIDFANGELAAKLTLDIGIGARTGSNRPLIGYSFSRISGVLNNFYSRRKKSKPVL
jgi:hypothetical protein